jgi:hypothetical protein
MNRNKKEKRIKQAYAAPRIIDTFSEEELLKNIAGSTHSWDVIPRWDNDPSWIVKSG